MAKKYYIYNNETCRFEPYRPVLQDRIFNLSSFLVVSAIIGILGFTAYSLSFSSPYTDQLREENQEWHLKYRALHKEIKKQEQRLEAICEHDDHLYRPVYEAAPISSQIRQAGIGGTERYREILESRAPSKHTIYRMKESCDQMRRQLYVQSKSFDELFQLAKNKNKMLNSIPAIQPIPKGKFRNISSGFGYRRDPILGIPRFHAGMDFAARRGTEIVSTGDGVVEFSGYRSGYGYTVIIDHGFGYKTLYGHCSKLLVKTGESVKRGTSIARVGSTGKSTGMHLHYEVIRNGRKVNPINYYFNDLNEDEYELMVHMSSEANDAPQDSHEGHTH